MVDAYLVVQGQIIRSVPRIDRHGGLFRVELKRHFSWCSCRSIAKATFLMAKGDGFHGSEGRKATFFIVQRRQLSWILEPIMATFLMAPRWANLFNRFLEERAIATFFMVQGRQAFSKTGQKRTQKRLTSAQLAGAIHLWNPELNEPKRRFSWFKATFPMVDRHLADKAKKCTRFSSLVASY